MKFQTKNCEIFSLYTLVLGAFLIGASCKPTTTIKQNSDGEKVPDEGTVESNPDEGTVKNNPDEGTVKNNPDEGTVKNNPDEGTVKNNSDEGTVKNNSDEGTVENDSDEGKIAATFKLSVNVNGLGSRQSISMTNGTDVATIKGSGTISFAPLKDGRSYNVAILTQSPYQSCKLRGDDAGSSGTGQAVQDQTVTLNVDCTCNADRLPDALQCLPIKWEDLGFYSYMLYLPQPLDHAHPDGKLFVQRAVLSLPWGGVEKNALFVFGTGGYNVGNLALSDLSDAFTAVSVQFEHRYFGRSWPTDDAGVNLDYDFRYLNVEQTAYDAHNWIQTLSPYFTGKRVMSGVSKGGVHSLVFAKYFPNDVDATVAYVAPNIKGIGDTNFRNYLLNMGGENYTECRNNLQNYIVESLKRRAEIVALIPQDSEIIKNNPDFDPDKGFEGAIDFRWGFWQHSGPSTQHNCKEIPPINASNFPILSYQFLVTIKSNIVDRTLYVNEQNWGSTFWWQANTEMGTVDYGSIGEIDSLKKYKTTSTEEFPPFTPARMEAVERNTAETARRVILIYGELDPWSARLYEVKAENDSYRYMATGLNHGASIKNLSEKDYEATLSKLEEWLNVKRLTRYRRVAFKP